LDIGSTFSSLKPVGVAGFLEVKGIRKGGMSSMESNSGGMRQRISCQRAAICGNTWKVVGEVMGFVDQELADGNIMDAGDRPGCDCTVSFPEARLF
jgi:hypothetical protein